MAALAISIIIALSAGGGVAFAAQNAVPGDMLYPVKVNVDEKVESALAFSAQAKAGLDVSFAEERMREAAVLSARGTLTTAAQANLRTRLEDNLNSLASDVATLRADGDEATAASISAKVHSSVGAHTDVLRNLGVDVSTGASSSAQQETKTSSTSERESGQTAATTSAFEATRNGSKQSGVNADTNANVDAGVKHTDSSGAETNESGSAEGGGTVHINLPF